MERVLISNVTQECNGNNHGLFLEALIPSIRPISISGNTILIKILGK
jgi:hypothetical protein